MLHFLSIMCGSFSAKINANFCMSYSFCRGFHFKVKCIYIKSKFSCDNKVLPLYTLNHRAFTGSSLNRKNYGHLSENDVSFFRSILGPNGIINEPDELLVYNTDWLNSHKGSSSLVLLPKTTDHVSKILAYCNEHYLAVCPQGGNTGLVGGSIPIYDELVISTSRMNRIEFFDDLTGVVICQAGCVLENIETYASKKDFTVPLDLGAKGSCHIGGNIATNAGGLRLLRYGCLHANVLGLEVVLADGSILNCMNTMRKDNTGYDLKHLFIGSEGTLGIITKAAILCYPKPSSSAVALLGCNTFDDVLSSSQIIRKRLPEVLSSLEMIDCQAMDAVVQNLQLSIPINPHPFYIIIEIAGSDSLHNEENLNDCLKTLTEKNIVTDGTIATDAKRIQGIWALRERITEALRKDGWGYKYDISVPLQNFYEIVDIMRKKLTGRITRCCGYGHLGDGNLHFNVTTPNFDSDVLKKIEPYIYEWIVEKGGSISAEHGIGFKKKQFLHLCNTSNAISIMKSFKHLLDPTGILNPYKIFP